jgi:hypothetical protein
MEAIQHPLSSVQLPAQSHKISLLSRFFSWCATQEENRLLWLALMITAHGCVITPVTLGIVMLFGNNFIYWPWVIAAMTAPLVVNLAALPARITIPVFFIGLLVDMIVIINSIAF